MSPDRPAPVRLDDLAAPRFTPEALQLRTAIAAMGADVSLDPVSLCADAAAATGLADFGDPGFRERLTVLVEALEAEAGLSPAGRFMQRELLLQLLRNRLLIQDLLVRHPEIHDVPITRPIIICGLPRTGTTHLHNLLAVDPSLRTLPYWESLEPVLAEHERPAPGETDPRILRCQQACAFLELALPHFRRMHEMTWDHIHEEIQLLAIDFSTMLFETIAPMPRWRDYYRAQDQTPHYEYLKTVLRVLSWLRGTGLRWTLKSPQHVEQLPVLARVFPDATFVLTHRDPVAVTRSMATMIAYSSRLAHTRVDPPRIGAYWAARVEEMLHACARDRDALPADQTLDVRFDDFMADDIAMVRRIYALAGQPFDAALEASMHTFMKRNPRGRFGGLVYDPAPLGLDLAERRTALRFYSTRFGLSDES